MPRVGKNPNWNRFYLIMKRIISYFNLPDMSQPELIAKCYDWYEPFASIWKEYKNDEEYKSWLIYRGIGNSYSTSVGIDGIDYPDGLINDNENRRKAAQRICENFEDDLTTDKLCYINSNIISFLNSDKKDGFVSCYSRRVSDINLNSLKSYLKSHIVPLLEQIEDPYEKFSAILIYAQSGCIPLDVYESEKERSERQIAELRSELENRQNNKDGGINEVYRSSEYRELTDPFFCGTFYGYFRQYHSESCEGAYKGLVPFELTIDCEGISANAVLAFERRMPNGNIVPICMTGKPMIGRELVHIVLQAENSDDFITMSYKWISLKNTALQFRRGVLITMDRSERCPQVQNFVFFNQPIAKENEKFVDAFLRFSGDRFVVPDEDIADLPLESTHFLQKYGKPISGYLISEKQAILNAQYDDITDNEIVKELLEIKQQSLSSLILNAKEEKQISDFFRSMILSHDKQNSSDLSQ